MYLTHSVIRSDGVIHNNESYALNKLHEYEGISLDVHNSFLSEIENLEANQIYKLGLEALKQCSQDEQRKVLAWIHAIVEIDKTVDVKEARFLLYAINSTDINLEEVFETSKTLPKLS